MSRASEDLASDLSRFTQRATAHCADIGRISARERARAGSTVRAGGAMSLLAVNPVPWARSQPFTLADEGSLLAGEGAMPVSNPPQ